MKIILAAIVSVIFYTALLAQPQVAIQPKPDVIEAEVIYGRRDGMALTMTIIEPKKPNGKAILSLVSSGFGSDIQWLATYYSLAIPFVKEGYTVFLTLHSACPRYCITDAFEDIQRAVQYVRYNSGKYKIDPDNIGIMGSSSGGVLALLAGTADDIKKKYC